MHTGWTIRAVSAQRLGIRVSGVQSTWEPNLDGIKGALDLDVTIATRVLVASRNLD